MALFSPSAADVRRFFCSVYAKRQAGQLMDKMESLADQWIIQHPEYHATLSDVEQAVASANETPALDSTNPFLHLSMHLSLSEQYAIDQPRGIRQALDLLTIRLGDAHAAQHAAMEALGRMLWESQRSGKGPDGEAYVADVQRQATRD